MPERGGEMASQSQSSLVAADYAYRPSLQWQPEVYAFFNKAYGVQHFRKICEALSRPSIYSCIRVNTLQTTRSKVVEKLVRILEKDCDHASFVPRNEELKESHMFLSTSVITRQLQKLQTFQSKLQDQVLATMPTEFSPTNAVSTDALLFEHPSLENIIIVKGSGPHQVDYGAETKLKEVIVSRKCAEAVLRGANVFVPGVLACSGHLEKGDIVALSAAVERSDGNGNWAVGITRGTVLYSGHAKSQFEDSARKGWFIGKGKTLLSRAGLFREKQGVAIEMVDRVYKHPPFHGILKGEIFLQNLPSIIAAVVLDPKAGEHILDMCAAPGGKTTAIAILMQDKGRVIAIDRSHNKVMDILNLAEEMKLTCISAFKLDALKSVRTIPDCDARNIRNHLDHSMCQESEALPASRKEFAWRCQICSGCGCSECEVDLPYEGSRDPTVKCVNDGSDSSHCCDKGKLTKLYTSKAEARKEARRVKNGPGKCQNSGERTEQVNGFLPNSFGRVLLDAPCSALGLRPRLFAGEETLEQLRQYGRYQRRMFDQAVQLVQPGGIIVYSTCTINPGENEAVVRYALDTYKFLSLVPQDPKLGGPGLTGGLDVFDGMSYKEWLKDDEKHLVQRFDPSGPLDTIGFFIAKFKVGSKHTEYEKLGPI